MMHYYQIRPEKKLQLKNNKFFLLLGPISIFIIYYLIANRNKKVNKIQTRIYKQIRKVRVNSPAKNSRYVLQIDSILSFGRKIKPPTVPLKITTSDKELFSEFNQTDFTLFEDKHKKIDKRKFTINYCWGGFIFKTKVFSYFIYLKKKEKLYLRYNIIIPRLFNCSKNCTGKIVGEFSCCNCSNFYRKITNGFHQLLDYLSRVQLSATSFQLNPIRKYKLNAVPKNKDFWGVSICNRVFYFKKLEKIFPWMDLIPLSILETQIRESELYTEPGIPSYSKINFFNSTIFHKFYNFLFKIHPLLGI